MSQTTTRNTALPTLRDELLSQLNTLLRLTRTEEMITQVRRTQARTDAVERELARSAGMCRERAALLRELIPALEGVYDAVGAAVGRLSAAAKTQLEQGTTLPEALFSDLALEHQLLDRARYVKRLGEAAQQPRVVEVMARLEMAHTATVVWLDSILTELAAGQPAELRPTTTQAAVASGRRIASSGARHATHAVNRSVAVLGQLQDRYGHTPGEVSHRVTRGADRAVNIANRRLGRDTNDMLTAGRDAALNRAESVAPEDGNNRTAQDVHDPRASVGALRVEELPIPDYDTLSAGMAASRIETLHSVYDVEVVLTYERANKARAGATRAAETRIDELSPELSDATS